MNKHVSTSALTLCIFGLAAFCPAVFGEETKAPMADESAAPSAKEAATSGMEAAAPAMEAPKAPAMDEALMARMKDYATPNENHKVLQAFVGTWTATMKSRMDAKSEPVVSEGVDETQWILGGRYLQEKFTGMFMGESYEGMGIIGYDNIKKEYEYLWLDNMGTGIVKITAQYDPATKTFAEQGEVSCPITNGPRAIHGKVTIVDDAHCTQEFYMKDPKTGEEFKSMEISYSRVE